jgi:hypothetical protein
MLRDLDWLHDELDDLHEGDDQSNLIIDLYLVHIRESVPDQAAGLALTVPVSHWGSLTDVNLFIRQFSVR